MGPFRTVSEASGAAWQAESGYPFPAAFTLLWKGRGKVPLIPLGSGSSGLVWPRVQAFLAVTSSWYHLGHVCVSTVSPSPCWAEQHVNPEPLTPRCHFHCSEGDWHLASSLMFSSKAEEAPPRLYVARRAACLALWRAGQHRCQGVPDMVVSDPPHFPFAWPPFLEP